MTADIRVAGPARSARANKAVEHGIWGAVIDGALVLPDSSSTFGVVEPATGREIARVVAGDAALVDQAVVSARRAYETDWRDRSPRDRAALLRALAEVIRANADELEELETREVGKPRHIAANDVRGCHSSFDYYAALADSLHGELLDHGLIQSHIIYEPYGVVAGVLPFNWPPSHFGKKSAPALIAGNTIVLKPGEQAPLTALRLAEIAAGVLPPGVLNAVPGIDAGPALVSHPLVSRVSFTGASATGRRVLAATAANVTYTTLELGGKNALLVLEDADVELASRIAVESTFYNQGEACSSTSRILVHEAIYGDFLDRFSKTVVDLKVGDGLDAATEIGAMVDAHHYERVVQYLQIALDEGARIYAQGTVPDDPRLRGGYWVAPTILVDVAPDSTVAREEIFGPIVCVMPFHTDDEAVAIANNTQYGLYAGVCSGDEVRARSIALRLEVGAVYVNNYSRRGNAGSPSGGVKASGFGRENSPATLHEYVRSKSIRSRTGRAEIPTWPFRD